MKLNLDKILSYTPIVSYFKYRKIKNKYFEIYTKMDEMISSNEWSEVASNYGNDDILYSKDNCFLYINTGQVYTPNLNPNIITITWVNRYIKNIDKWKDYFSIDTIVPELNDIDTHNATYILWIHPETNIEDEYYISKYKNRITNTITGIAVGLISLVCGIISFI